MGAVALVALREMRRRWQGVVALTLLIGLVGAAVLAAGAGARRTGTALDRFRETSLAADIELAAFTPLGGAPIGPEIITGRAPRDENEVALGSATLKKSGKAIGDMVHVPDSPRSSIRTYSPATSSVKSRRTLTAARSSAISRLFHRLRIPPVHGSPPRSTDCARSIGSPYLWLRSSARSPSMRSRTRSSPPCAAAAEIWPSSRRWVSAANKYARPSCGKQRHSQPSARS